MKIGQAVKFRKFVYDEPFSIAFAKYKDVCFRVVQIVDGSLIRVEPIDNAVCPKTLIHSDYLERA